MIIQAPITDIKSRQECNPYINGKLPLITAPMSSVADESNYKEFLKHKIDVCLPRGCKIETAIENDIWYSCSLIEFIELLYNFNFEKSVKICIDTAAGHLKQLHDAIKFAKSKFGDKITIMAGNVSSVQAFIELANTGVDYIRVGIGGGGGCNTTNNTGVGQICLETLIKNCYSVNSNVKIVADGISAYLKQVETKYNFNDNGYAAINKLLFSGADYVMVGRLFAQTFESAGEKIGNKVVYSGMSTKKEQTKYGTNRHSEGSVKLIDIKYSLEDWINGNDSQDEYPYLAGFTNCLKSAMSYTDCRDIKNFIGGYSNV